jgi:hypothetical protein
MTDRRGDHGFAVATQSIRGGTGGRRPRAPRRIGVAIVLIGSVALVVVGFVGPRISGPPSFDLGYFATPTTHGTPSPTATPTLVNQTPPVTPLPVLTRPDDAPALDGQLILTGSAIQRLDLATGRIETLLPMTPWQDGVIHLGVDRVACLCIETGYGDQGPTRTVRLTQVDTVSGATVTSELATYRTSPDATQDQPDPLFDAAVDRTATHGLLAVAARTAGDWRISVRAFDPRAGASGPAHPLGPIPIPPFPGLSQSPAPSDAPTTSSVYLDGPRIRLSPDGRTAFVFAVAQRYSDNGEPAIAREAWRLRLAADGSVEDVAPFADLAELSVYCAWIAFTANDRLTAICGEPEPTDQSGTRWSARVFDSDGRLVRTIAVLSSGPYGYVEPLVDDANGRLFLWDQVGLKLVRVDVDDGSVVSATFDPAASSAAGVTRGDASGTPSWRDTESALQQSPYDLLAGSPDGSRLFATGFQPREEVDFYGQRSLGVFVIDPETLALLQHWAPIANDITITVLSDDRVVVGGQPGMNAAGDQVPWEGSLTIRATANGTVLARYGRVSTDMPAVLRP